MFLRLFSLSRMIRSSLSLWRFFKAVVVVGYMLHTVFLGLYNPNRRNMYKELILSPRSLLKKSKQKYTKRNLSAVPTSIKAACQKSPWVKLDDASISVNIFRILGAVYLGEKMNTNIKFDPSDLLEGVFEDSMWIWSEGHQRKNFEQFKKTDLCENYAKFAIPAEYGHKIISRLKIKEALVQQADEWVNSNLQEDWVSVHYRGTDRRDTCTSRLIETEDYIAYLKEVLDDQCSIFACSDQTQFIEQIKEAFPGRVFSREITRSYDNRPLHRSITYRGNQQMQDALIDILILSKTKLIYTPGSWFIEIVRFFNPAVKIVSFELMRPRFKYLKKINNFIPIPKAHFLKKKFAYTKNVPKTAFGATMIRATLTPWYRFKAVVVVGYMLHTVFLGLYNPNRRNMYKELILSPRSLLKKSKQQYTKRNLLAIPTSIKVASQKTFWVKLDGPSISVNIFRILGAVYLGEKMNTNIKFDPTDLLEGVFEDSMWICSEEHQCRGFKRFKKTDLCENYAKFAIPAEYGHKIISRLKIKEALLQQADEWVNSNLQGDWVSVHYRGTNTVRRYIAIEAYIAYLKEVLDDQCSIFACSDQAQFIEQIKEAFPGRVFSREITRSYDNRPLHKGKIYRSTQQVQDALIDILILSKAKLIYTTGSWFVEIVRFFNPAVKIISFELMRPKFKYHRKIDNFIPIPKAHLLKIKHIPPNSD